MHDVGRRAVLLASAIVFAACSTEPLGKTPAPAATAVPTAYLAASPTPEVASQAPTEPRPTTDIPTDPTPPPGSELLTVLACPQPRPIVPACLDTATNGETPGRTASVKVGESATFSITIHNAGTTTSAPITLLLFTFEPPFVSTFIRPTACNGCRIGTGNVGGEVVDWPGSPPGDHVLTVTITATGRPTTGGFGGVADAYEWDVALYAEPFEAVNAYGPIYTSAAFALATGLTTIKP
jgi:hypothetical protein